MPSCHYGTMMLSTNHEDDVQLAKTNLTKKVSAQLNTAAGDECSAEVGEQGNRKDEEDEHRCCTSHGDEDETDEEEADDAASAVDDDGVDAEVVENGTIDHSKTSPKGRRKGSHYGNHRNPTAESAIIKEFLDKAKDDFKQKWDNPASVGILISFQLFMCCI
uniref:Uncharacterized protein n=1 Tax=Globodera rostochiensis TaxID=31243 RepID=A0A914I0F5_GLORO